MAQLIIALQAMPGTKLLQWMASLLIVLLNRIGTDGEHVTILVLNQQWHNLTSQPARLLATIALQRQKLRQTHKLLLLLLQRKGRRRSLLDNRLQEAPTKMTVKAMVQNAIAIVAQAAITGLLTVLRALLENLLHDHKQLLDLLTYLGGIACPTSQRIEQKKVDTAPYCHTIARWCVVPTDAQLARLDVQ